MDLRSEKWILLGASKGLGKSFALLAAQKKSLELISISRKANISADFSQAEKFSENLELIQKFEADRVFYFAGGGPYGKFQDKAWKDHEWALNVNFRFPAFLLHQLLQSQNSIKQIVFVGSSIAESSTDPKASMYCASKHALKALLMTVQEEMKDLKSTGEFKDIRLFSPGYMDTGLLPAHAWPRQAAGLLVSPDKNAELLWAWIHNEDDAGSHLVLNSRI